MTISADHGATGGNGVVKILKIKKNEMLNKTTVRFITGCLVLGLILCSQFANALGIVIAGQELGKSTWGDRIHIPSSRYKVLDVTNFKTIYAGHEFYVEGQILKNVNGQTRLFYAENGVLVGADVFARPEKPNHLLREIARRLGAAAGKDGGYVKGNATIYGGVPAGDGEEVVRIALPAFSTVARLPQNPDQDASASNGLEATLKHYLPPVMRLGGVSLFIAIVIVIVLGVVALVASGYSKGRSRRALDTLAATPQPRIRAFPNSLEKQVQKITIANSVRHNRLIIIGSPNAERRFYAFAAEVGRLRVQSGTRMLNLSWAAVAKYLKRQAAESKEEAHWAMVIEAPRSSYGVSWRIFASPHRLNIFVSGNIEEVKNTLRECVDTVDLLQRKGCVALIRSPHGTHDCIPRDADGCLITKHGTFVIESRVGFVDLLYVLQTGGSNFIVRDTSGTGNEDDLAARGCTGEGHAPMRLYPENGQPAVSGVDALDFAESAIPGNHPTEINPATGLPAINGIGSPDIAGNEWGRNQVTEVNPASGLPATNGMGSPDIAGNSWGSNEF
jgi:type IV secretory pathway VirB2 component (pilin)